MKRARFTEDQIIGVLKEHEAGAKTADLARKHGVSEATLYNWKAKYGGMDVSEAKRLKQLEDENAKLKKLLAEQMLDAAALRELLSKKPPFPRGSVSDIVGCSSCCGRRASPRASTASTGFIAKKASRCASEGLGGAPWGRGRRSWSKSKPNARWSVDFVHDQLACGRRLRILNIVDDVTRECLAAIPDTSISGRRVARELTALIKRRNKPGVIVSDNGTEFTSNAMFAWAQDNRSSGISLRQESRCRMASARVSTGACATSFSTRACSSASIMPGPRSRTGSTITTSDGRTRRWAISHRWPMPPISPQHAIVCATPTSSADRMLLHPRPTA